MFCVKRSTAFCVGKRTCTLNIIEKCKDDVVYSVNIDVREQFGESTGTQTSMSFVRNNRCDVLSSVVTLSSASYDSFRMNYSSPSLPDIEATAHFCRTSGCGSFSTLEKKKVDGREVVERVKTTHAFHFGGDETVCVKVKITNDKKVGLRVEVERPVKLTTDYSDRVIEKMEEKMEREIRNNVLSTFRNVSHSVLGKTQETEVQTSPKISRTVSDSDSRVKPKSRTCPLPVIEYREQCIGTFKRKEDDYKDKGILKTK